MNTAVTLYTREVLALATALARWPYDAALPLHGSARAQTCGSTVDLTMALGPDGRIAALGLRARTCAIGQAAAALFAEAAAGRDQADVATALAGIEAWLAGGPLPDWPGFSVLAAARDFPARHGAILLPCRAALVALGTPR